MKPNLILVQPPHVKADEIIDRFCETLCETHYVYVIRPLPAFREDSPAGVRYLNFSPERLPGFGEVESVIVVDSPDLLGRLEEKYPTARHSLWNLEADGEFPEALVSPATDTVIQGQFGRADQEFARAI